MVCDKIDVKLACFAINISRSGYYRWLYAPESSRKIETKKLTIEVKKIHDISRSTYGVPRIFETLKGKGMNHGKARIYSIMKELNISGNIKRRFKISTTDSKHDLPIADRIFKTECKETHATEPNQIWHSDITYISTDEGFVFLGAYIDNFTRKITGFSMADNMKTDLLLEGLKMALGRQKLADIGLTIHTDRGSQYASEAFRLQLKNLEITPSMSRKGNCYDNANAETFFGTLNSDLVYRTHFKTRKAAMDAVFEYIEVFYNRIRIHSSLGYLTPVTYEEAQLAA